MEDKKQTHDFDYLQRLHWTIKLGIFLLLFMYVSPILGFCWFLYVFAIPWIKMH